MTVTPPLGISERQRRTFQNFIEQQGECLIWMGAKTRKDWRGYAVYGITGAPCFVLHRRLWIEQRGDLRDDQFLDHLCRNRACINLDHLEVVTVRQNVVERGVGITAQNALKTKCPKGHDYDYVTPDGKRGCKTCRSENRRRYRARMRAAGLQPK